MIATSRNRIAGLGCAAVLAGAGLSAIFAGCADTEAGDRAPLDAGPSIVPDAPPDPIEDASADADGNCDASDPNCVTATIGCEDTAWCPVTTSIDPRFSLTAVWGTSSADIWVVGAAGTNAHWDGAKWTILPSITPYTLRAISGTAADDIWTVSTPDTLFHYAPRDGGPPAWEKTPVIVSGPQYASSLSRAVWSRGDDVLVAGDVVSVRPPRQPVSYQQEWLSKRDPIAWTALPGFEALNVYGVWGTTPDDLWVVGFSTKRGGTAYRRGDAPSDGGRAGWIETDIQESDALTAVWGTSASDVWAVGGRGLTRHYTNDAWQIVQSPTTENLRAIWGASSSDIWAVGDFGTLLHFDGTTWKPASAAFTNGIKPHLYGIWGSSSSDVWAVGQGGVVLHFTGRIPDSKGATP